jgi:hypothetical protein
MSNERPITPPPELVRHWSRFQGDTDPEALWFRIANEAAQWGANQELEASVSWLIENQNPRWAHALRTARRPRPPSLKEQALEALSRFDWNSHTTASEMDADFRTIHRALEAMPND